MNGRICPQLRGGCKTLDIQLPPHIGFRPAASFFALLNVVAGSKCPVGFVASRLVFPLDNREDLVAHPTTQPHAA